MTVKKDKKNEFQVFCRYCNQLLFRTEFEIYTLFFMKMKCPRCKKKLTSKEDVKIGHGRVLTNSKIGV